MYYEEEYNSRYIRQPRYTIGEGPNLSTTKCICGLLIHEHTPLYLDAGHGVLQCLGKRQQVP